MKTKFYWLVRHQQTGMMKIVLSLVLGTEWKVILYGSMNACQERMNDLLLKDEPQKDHN